MILEQGLPEDHHSATQALLAGEASRHEPAANVLGGLRAKLPVPERIDHLAKQLAEKFVDLLARHRHLGGHAHTVRPSTDQFRARRRLRRTAHPARPPHPSVFSVLSSTDEATLSNSTGCHCAELDSSPN